MGKCVLELAKNTAEIQKDKADTLSQAPAHAETNLGEPQKFKSLGWRIHNEITYRGVDFLLNSTIGVAFAYWAGRTKMGMKYFTTPVSNIGKAAMRPFTSNPATLEEGAKWGARISSIIIGGTAIIPPMVLLENKKNKKAIVCALDKMIYGEEAVKNDPKFAELHESIQHEPKKDFWTGMAARIAVLIPMFAWTMTPKLNDASVKYAYEPIGKGTKFLANTVGIKANKMKTTMIDGQSNWDFLHQTIGLDAGLTFIYSFLHEYAFKAFAAMRGKKEEPVIASNSITRDHTTSAYEQENRSSKFVDYVTNRPQPSLAMGAA